MKRLVLYALAAAFSASCAYAGDAVVTRNEDVRIEANPNPNIEAAKQKTKRAAKKAKAKTKAAAKRTRAAAQRGAERTRAAGHRAAERVREANSRPVARVETTVETHRGEAVVERNR